MGGGLPQGGGIAKAGIPDPGARPSGPGPARPADRRRGPGCLRQGVAPSRPGGRGLIQVKARARGPGQRGQQQHVRREASMSQSSTPSLYAAREPVFPRRVKGKFRSLKWVIMAVTLGIYYLLPWMRWDRGPELPDQAVLVDMAGRRFFFFWIEIWPHEFYFVAGLLIMAGLGLFLFTSALGRVWCGYACPQTVWTDLFILTERWVEGDRNARVRLWNAPWDLRKARLRLTKWTIWLGIGLATGRGLGLLLRRRADAAARPRDRAGASRGLRDDRHADRDDLPLRRLLPRADLHLRLPLAAHPGRDDGRGDDHHRLPRLAGRAAGQGRPRAPRGPAAPGLPGAAGAGSAMRWPSRGWSRPRRPARQRRGR